MPVNSEILRQIRELLGADRELLLRVQSAESHNQAANLLVAAAATQGIAVTREGLLACFALAIQGGTQAQSLCDEHLDAVAGGMPPISLLDMDPYIADAVTDANLKPL